MRSIIRKFTPNGFESINIEDVKTDRKQEVIMSIDGSTTCSGVELLHLNSQALYSMAFVREKGETAVQYKVRWKRELLKIFKSNPNIYNVYYEEPFLGYVESAKILMSLRTSVEELIEEESPALNHLKVIEVPNKWWKKRYLAPETVPNDSELEKAAVKKKTLELCPFMAEATQDEMDALGIGLAILQSSDAFSSNDISLRKKVRKFKYDCTFIGANTDEEMLDMLEYVALNAKAPGILLSEPEFYTLPGTGNFDEYVNRAIGDEDKLVVLKYRSDKYGNIALEYMLGNLTRDNKYIYAICWRKNRK